ncbi:S41 family peptidase [Winogradskyella flava]|uniref:Tail specific protease domain-containing protein n=1 Tax=Winogradskyella flava TaxID=1884876 RepID=A0A842IUT7_9FLAO|nr:S41 family peptidase [Winogradskyella flava]MBC2846555.1 hypothetical protein [Winogradskyella flava]
MKKILQILTFIVLSLNLLIAQKSITEIERLASLGKIYGFLKYYHPEVAKGKIDWDQALINHFPKVMNATDKKSLSIIYNNWIDNLGKIDPCKKCDSKENYFENNFDLSWIQDTLLFSNSLISKLKYIEKNRIQSEHFYASNEPVGKIKITNEKVYEDFDYPNEAFRILGLFKYWNIIEYFYPYKYLTDQNWELVLKEMIPKFQSASNKIEYQSIIKELIAKLDDSHAWISFNSQVKYKYLPVQISHIENQCVISGYYNDSLANINNLKLGDVILKINGSDIKSETNKKLKFVSGSNTNNKLLKAYNEIFNGIDSIVTLTIKRDKHINELDVKKYDFRTFNYYNNPKNVISKSINDDLGYINMANVKSKDVSDIFESFKTKKSIIIDLRNYPALIYKSMTRYLNSEKRDFAKIYIPNINYPGKFRYKDNIQTSKRNNPFKGKIIMVVNEASLSRSEFTAMAFQAADNIITVGNQTAGADGDVAIFEFLGGYRTAISGNGILYPDGTETQRKGVKIDIEVKPTITGLKQGRDELLEKAIELASDE